ncbi:pituitary tumor-transforming gene 1 protein-interacting protein [Myotis yumanensis]|uniref:pituitary tumor-transforming gene 1 protein-interacting protein n=1 Tax=Myotis yumanensis TaxID=159337 RepID=UPI0038D0ED6D
MGSGGACGRTVCWGLPLGGATLLLLLLQAAAVQESPGSVCSQNTNKTCEECLKNVSCLWCNTDKTCVDYPVAKILPPASLCKLSSARWGVCWVNFEALIIAMSVVGGLILLAVATCCCYCCYCRKKKSRKPDKSEEKAMREQEERRIRQEERRAEMKSRHDEIRKKYGLFKEENPYARFEN